MGMSLSEILDRLIQLERLDDKPFEDVQSFVDQVKEIYSNVKFANRLETAIAAKNLHESIVAYRNEIEILRSKLEKNVYENQEQFIAESEKFYQQNINKMTFEEHDSWADRWIVEEKDVSQFSNRISNYCHWQQPALVLGSNKSDVITSLVSADPLYVMERYREYFHIQKRKFANNSARKIRFYSVDEMKLLPNDSFSVMAVYNQFNFLPWNQVSDIITTFSRCLAPGGTLVFNYNNCRTVKGFRFFEKQLASFSLESMYVDLCSKLGLELTYSYDSNSAAFSFLEFTKPGKLTLIKKYPSLGIVKRQDSFGNKISQEVRTKRLIHIFKS